MPQIIVRTQIDATPALCFDLARNIDVHCHTCAWTGERAVGGRTHGLFGAGDYVTFEARHFGVRQRLTAAMTRFDPPHCFAEAMVRGAFKMLRHQHDFIPSERGTVMVDHLEFQSPFGLLGRLVDRLFLAAYMRRFLVRRNQNLKCIAESARS